ncbi:MAG: aldolase [Acidobacteria bacterium]|nr:aldolase [Acidobacteriota bacterium]
MTVTSSNVETAAYAATLGFHFLWVEMEHSPVSLESLRAMVLATRGLPAPVFARVPWAELWMAKRVLDQGVQGVIFPFVSTPQRATIAAQGCHYPPFGRRGSGAGLAVTTWPAPGNYYDSADANVLVVCVIEEASAIDEIEAIAATPGVDVIFIGVSDLSFSLGLRGRQNEPLLDEAIARIMAAAKRHGKILGRPAGSAEEVKQFRAEGFQFFQSMTELGLIKLGAKALLEPLGIKDKPQEQSTFY